LICNALFPGIYPAVQIAMTLVIGMAVGSVNGLLITKLRMNALLETLAANIVLRGFVLLFIPFSILDLAPGYIFAGSARTVGNVPVAVFTMLGTFFIFGFIMQKTRFGRFMIATGGNPKASYIAGIKVDKMVIAAFALSGLFSALAGILVAGRQASISNSMGSGLAIMSIAGAILGGVSLFGGRGTVSGMLGGALLLSMFGNFLNLLAVNVYLVNIIKGFLILFAIILDSVKLRLRLSILSREKIRKLKEPAHQVKPETSS
jgi:simple sugar transport system permease protein